MKIAILDDDPIQLKRVEMALIGGDNQWGEEVICRFFSNATALLELIKKEFFDCFILDRRLSDMDGDLILQWIRQYGERTHQDYSIVIMLTSMRSENDIIEGLSFGANDYITKPFRPAELVARVKRAIETKRSIDKSSNAKIKSQTAADLESDVLDFYGYRFLMFSRAVEVNGEAIYLTDREFSLALLLFRNMGRALSRQMIFEVVWLRFDSGSSLRTLDTHIHRIRQRLNLNRESGIVLKPIYGFGYRLDVLNSNDPATL